MATTRKVKCVICGHRCRVMAYYGDKVCSQRCNETRMSLRTNGAHVNGYRAAMRAVPNVEP